MPDAYGIKDLPDEGKIIDSTVYLVEGKQLNVLYSVLKQLWRGENVQRGPNIFIRQFGEGGYSISSTASGSGSGGSSHAYTVSDASTATTPAVTVSPGTHNGVTPTIYGTPINTKIGSPPAYPVLTLGGSDTVVYFQIDYNSSGQIIDVSISSGTSVPTATIVFGSSGSDYKFLSSVEIAYASGTGKASVLCNNDGVSGPQGYAQCGGSSSSWLV